MVTPDLKGLARSALLNCSAFADAATKTGDGKSQSYRRISEAYKYLARLIIMQMNIEADERRER
jgi:hypothetical protein